MGWGEGGGEQSLPPDPQSSLPIQPGPYPGACKSQTKTVYSAHSTLLSSREWQVSRRDFGNGDGISYVKSALLLVIFKSVT